MVKAPIWAAWLCCALGFVGAGLSKRPIRGAAIGAAFGLIPAAVIWLLDGLNHDGSSSIGMLVFLGIMAAAFSRAVTQTIRDR